MRSFDDTRKALDKERALIRKEWRRLEDIGIASDVVKQCKEYAEELENTFDERVALGTVIVEKEHA